MRRFSRSSSIRNNQSPQAPPTAFHHHHQHHGGGAVNQSSASSGIPSAASSTRSSSNQRQPVQSNRQATSPLVSATLLNGNSNGVANNGRPMSAGNDQTYVYATETATMSNRPATAGHHQPHQPQPAISGGTNGINSINHGLSNMTMNTTMPQSAIGNLSRTDQIVLKHFWEYKYQENCKRDLHYLKFPFFPQFPSHRDLLPYCEIYHLVKMSPGANIISLGSANGVYIGFELQTGSQLHIDMEDEWHNISHHRIHFKSYESMVSSSASDNIFKTWPKPLTIEYLEEQYQRWCQDLTSLCWEAKEVRELGGTPGETPTQPHAGVNGGAVGGMTGLNGNDGSAPLKGSF